MAVTAPDGTDTALIVAVTFDGDEAVLVEATWTIPDAAAHGVYIVTTDVSGNMVAAHEEYIAVKAPDVGGDAVSKKKEREIFDELTAPLEDDGAGSLVVHVDYMGLVERYGDDEAWSRLIQLKGLLG